MFLCCSGLSSRRLAILFFSCVCVSLTLGYFLLLERPYDKHNISPFQTKATKNTKTENESNGRFIFVFSYPGQLSAATNHLIQLADLAAYGRRQVVLPFVAKSSLFGTKLDEQTATLGAYYNVTEFNHILRSYGYSTLVSWETFEATCKQTLDVLVVFRPANIRHSKHNSAREKTGPRFVLCDLQNKVFHGFEIGKTICVEAGTFRSLERFENEDIKDFPFVGIAQWGGTGGQNRTNFDLPSRNRSFAKQQLASVFNASLVQIAQDFITKSLQTGFIAIHIRSERMTPNGKDLSVLKKYLSQLTKNVLQTIAADTSRQLHNPKIFLSSDIPTHGSYSARMRNAREHGVDLIFKEYLSVLNATTFQPNLYKLTDRGAAAIVEMIILRQGKKLFLCGGGSFQAWIKYQYTAWNPKGLNDVYLSCT